MTKVVSTLGIVCFILVMLAPDEKHHTLIRKEQEQKILYDTRRQQVKQLEKIYREHTSAKIAHQVAWLTIEYSEKKQLPPLLVASVIIEESRVKPWAKGLAGEVGLMQIYPKFWKGVFPECGNNLWRPRTNICYGTSILHWSMVKSDSNFVEALHGYNGRVNNPTIDTQEYSKKVLARLGKLYLTTYNLKEN